MIHSEPKDLRADKNICLISQSGFAISATTQPASSILREFYDAYDLAFTLTNEKEEFAGFEDCLALNHGASYASLSAQFGDFREYVATIRTSPTGEFIGGMNFIVFSMAGLEIPRAPCLSVNLNYVFINEWVRRRGYFRTLIGEFAALARELFSITNPAHAEAALQNFSMPNLPVYVYIELNDPLRMPKQDYDTDTQISGLDQVSRIGIWGSVGAKIIDFPYVQPPLSAKQEADPNLVYAVLGVGEDRLCPSVLKAHLERFFAISVLKGRSPRDDPYVSAQLSMLSELSRNFGSIRLSDLKNLTLCEKTMARGDVSPGVSLREALSSTPFAGRAMG